MSRLRHCIDMDKPFVVWVHRGDDAEGRLGHDRADPRHGDGSVGHRRQKHIEGVLRCPVELLDVEESAVLHRLDQRALNEIIGAVVFFEHAGRIMMSHELGGSEVRVAFDKK